MTIPDQPSTSAADTPAERSTGVASAQHQGLRRPNDDQRVEQALDDVGLDDRGDVLEDHWRDRRSRGAPPPESEPDGTGTSPE